MLQYLSFSGKRQHKGADRGEACRRPCRSYHQVRGRHPHAEKVNLHTTIKTKFGNLVRPFLHCGIFQDQEHREKYSQKSR